MQPAAFPTGDRPAPEIDPARPAQDETTGRAAVQVQPRQAAPGQRQRVAPALARDAEFAASLPPLRAVGRDAGAFGPGVCDQMCQFMAQGAIDLGGIFAQARIEHDGHCRRPRQPGGTAQPPAPAHADALRQRGATDLPQQRRRAARQFSIPRPWRSWDGQPRGDGRRGRKQGAPDFQRCSSYQRSSSGATRKSTCRLKVSTLATHTRMWSPIP
jgi:hypothetical protein